MHCSVYAEILVVFLLYNLANKVIYTTKFVAAECTETRFTTGIRKFEPPLGNGYMQNIFQQCCANVLAAVVRS